jgi:hypothetical protein
MRAAMDLHAAIWFTHAFATDGSKHRDGRGLRMLQAEPGMEERATGRGMEGGRLPAT